MFAEIENAILTRLQLAGSPENQVLGYNWGTCESYPENWQDYLENNLALLRAPAVWVTFAGFSKISSSTRGVDVRATYGVIVAAKNYRNQRAARFGGAGTDEIGSYQLVNDVLGLLNGHNLGLDISDLEVQSVRFARSTPAMVKTGMSFLGIDLTTEFTLGFEADFTADDLGDFATFNVDWALPPATDIKNNQIISIEVEAA